MPTDPRDSNGDEPTAEGWRRFYAVVLGALVLDIALFAWITGAFS